MSDINKSDTVRALKDKIKSKLEIHPSVPVILSLSEKQLAEDDKTLSDYEITEESTISVSRPIVSIFSPSLLLFSSSPYFSQPPTSFFEFWFEFILH